MPAQLFVEVQALTFPQQVLAARERLAERLAQIERYHRRITRGSVVCAQIADVRDEIVLDLFDAALEDSGDPGQEIRRHVALVPHGGYGRRDVSPASDLDLMLLCDRSVAGRMGKVAQRLWRDRCDVGLVVGHSVRSVDEACRLAADDAETLTSLIEARFLAGSVSLFCRFWQRFCRLVRRSAGRLVTAIERARFEERMRFGETAYLLEPHVKRSHGGLRDIQMVRWLGMIGFGTPEPEELVSLGAITAQECTALNQAADFLLRVRNEMHFHAGRCQDVLSRWEQLRLAELFQYQASSGMLPVEHFMRHYFRHTKEVGRIANRLQQQVVRPSRWARLATRWFGRRIGRGFVVGRWGLAATEQARKRVQQGLAGAMELVDLASAHGTPIAAETWDLVQRRSERLPEQPDPESCRRFLAVLGRPALLGELLAQLHDTGLLECFIPAFRHAHGLLQFNQYHKYTVDEHCLRAVEKATELADDPGPLGQAYRNLPRKHVLHLALLVHDLGKGYPEDHSRVGRRIAVETAERLGLDEHDTRDLKFLVRKHLLMNHLAFRREIAEEQTPVQLAVEVASPELLGMLYALTAADLAAVGPGIWNSWKAELLTDLYQRTMQHLTDEADVPGWDQYAEQRRQKVCMWLGDKQHDRWFARQVEQLPATYLHSTPPVQIAADLRLLHRLAPGNAEARGEYRPETKTVEFTVATNEAVVPGIFHRLTGALTSYGLEILSAQINTLAEGFVVDRFQVMDPDYSGPPPKARIEAVCRSLVASLKQPAGTRMSFRRTWQSDHRHPTSPEAHSRVEIHNSVSAQYTVIDVFAVDRPGLLYSVTRTLYELGLSVARAKIGTYLDQVVDVFYVTDNQGRKIEQAEQIDQIRNRLLQAIHSETDSPDSLAR